MGGGSLRSNEVMRIIEDELPSVAVAELLATHLRGIADTSPPESVHALDLAGLRSPDVTFWTAWSGDDLLGCGVLRELGPGHGEIKSMRTAP